MFIGTIIFIDCILYVSEIASLIYIDMVVALR